MLIEPEQTSTPEEVRIDYQGDSQEAIYLFPKSVHPVPGVVYIHGHGGSAQKALGRARGLARQGYAVCLPSMRGYGLSEGAPDFMGPKTIAAVEQTAQVFAADPRVDSKRIALEGASRGAIVAAQIITQSNIFAVALLESGAYDLETEYLHNPPKNKELEEQIAKEMGENLMQGLRSRSAALNADKINCPVLILHGEKDQVFLAEQAEIFSSLLMKYNIPHQLHIIPGADHFLLGLEEIQKIYVFPFLDQYLQYK